MQRPLLLPSLSTQPKRKENCTNLEDLLPQLDSLSLESEDDRDATEDIFEEFHRDSFFRQYADPNIKYLPKTEVDRRTVNKFTDEFKRTIQTVRKETGVGDSLLDEEAAIINILEARPAVPSPNINFDQTRGTPIEIEGQRDEASVTSSESNFWKLLLANSSSKFQVSPPVFDAFGQEEKHWLERPAVPGERLEISRKKCKKWLDSDSKSIC